MGKLRHKLARSMQKVRVSSRDTMQASGGDRQWGAHVPPKTWAWAEVTHLPQAPWWLKPKFWVPGAESEWAQSYTCVHCYLLLECWSETQKTARKCAIMPGKQSLQFGLQFRENTAFFLLVLLLMKSRWNLLGGKECLPWRRLVLPRGWLVTRRCIEETCLMNPQKSPPLIAS